MDRENSSGARDIPIEALETDITNTPDLEVNLASEGEPDLVAEKVLGFKDVLQDSSKKNLDAYTESVINVLCDAHPHLKEVFSNDKANTMQNQRVRLVTELSMSLPTRMSGLRTNEAIVEAEQAFEAFAFKKMKTRFEELQSEQDKIKLATIRRQKGIGGQRLAA